MLLLSLLFSNNPLIPQLVKARDQFALGRRFLKFFKCVPMLRASVEGRRFGELDLADTLDVVRTAFMGLYLGVESATMVSFSSPLEVGMDVNGEVDWDGSALGFRNGHRSRDCPVRVVIV